ncbi:hypothetical protein BH18ACT4_BH18ACT4_11460 [soil metagenome]
MTETSQADAAPAFAPTGPPVVCFFAVLAAVAAVFAALWWSGLVAARVSIDVSNDFDRRSGTGVAEVVVRNVGPLPVDVGPLELSSRPDGRNMEPPVVLEGGAPPVLARLKSGDEVRVTVRYSVDCEGVNLGDDEGGYADPSLRVRLRAEGAVGVGRPVDADEAVLAGACGQPVDGT